jgi:arsenate reductase (glutaredoxin)
MSKLKVFQYPNCGTCKKALKWLDAHRVAYESVDITREPPTRAELERVLALTGLPIKKLFNTSGMAYREGNYAERLAGMSERDALTALTKNGKLVKRPVVLGANVALVGFRDQDYEQAFEAARRPASS